MEAEDVLVLSRKYTERLMQGAGDPAIVQNVTQIANITPNGKVHEIDFSDLVSGHKIIAPATGWMYAETSRGQAGKNAYVNIFVAKGSVDFAAPSSHYYSALNDRTYDIGITSALAPVTKGDTVEIYFNQPLAALRIFEVEPIEPKYITDRKELATLNFKEIVPNKIINIDDIDQYDKLEMVIINNSETVSRYIFENKNVNSFLVDYNLSVTYLRLIRYAFDKVPEGLKVRSKSGYEVTLNGMTLYIYGIKNISADDLVNPIVTDEKKLLYSGNVTAGGNITVSDMPKYDNIEMSGFLVLSNGEKRIFKSLPYIRDPMRSTLINFELGNVQSFIEAEYVDDTTIRLKNLKAANLNGYILHIEIHGYNDVNVKDLINPVVKDKEKLLYSGYVTGNGHITVGDMSKYDKIYIKAFSETTNGVRRLFDELELIRGSEKGTHISIYLNKDSLIGFYTIKQVDNTTVSISDYIALNYGKFYMEIYGRNEVLVNDLVNDLVIGDTVELYKGTPIKGINKLNRKIEDYDYYLAELIYNNRQREQLFIKVGDPFNILSPAGGTGYWEFIGVISGDDMNLSTVVKPSSASGITTLRITGIKTVTAKSLTDKLVLKDSKELAEILLSKSGDNKSQKVDGLEDYDYFEVFFIDANKKYSSAVNIVKYGESFMASNQYTTNLHRSILGDISNGAINITEVNGNLYPSYVKVIGYKTVSADDISDIVVSDRNKLVTIKASEVVNGAKRTLPNDVSYYDEIIAQLVIPHNNYVVETAPYFPEGLSEGLLVLSKSYTYGNNDYRRIDIRFAGAEIELFNINIAPDRDDCDLILYGVKNTSVDDITPKLVIDGCDLLLETRIKRVESFAMNANKAYDLYKIVLCTNDGISVDYAEAGLGEAAYLNWTTSSVVNIVQAKITSPEVLDIKEINLESVSVDTIKVYGINHTDVNKLALKSVDTLLERTEISGVMEYELQKTVEPYGMIIATLYGEWASSGLAKISEISLDAGVPSALIYNYDSDKRAFVNVKVEGSKATVSSFLKGSGIDRLYLKITNHKF